jgi:hypothetical protein
MIREGILYPQINSLLSRVRHTNLLMIADRGGRLSPMLSASGKKRTVTWQTSSVRKFTSGRRVQVRAGVQVEV